MTETYAQVMKHLMLNVPSLTENRDAIQNTKDTYLNVIWASQVVLAVKNPSANAGDTMQVPSLGREDPLKEGMATHSSILAYEIPWTERGAWQATVRSVAKSRTLLK